MKIAYVNAYYQKNHTGGGLVHMEQFITNAIGLGHEVWAYPGNSHPGVSIIPTDRIGHIKTMRQMDALYVRVEGYFPGACSWALPPRRWLYGFPIVVWEFNTVPEHGLLRGQTEENVTQNIASFRRYGKGCDLAICVTKHLADYVQGNLGIEHTKVIPNGSDPGLFYPDVPIAKRLIPFQGKFNVVWVGSGKEPWHDLTMLRENAQHIIESKNGNDIAFHLIGPDLTGIMAEMPENIFYWGAEYYQNLPAWLSGMDVGLSLYIPGPADFCSPLKVFDYMASGLTVISTPQPFMDELAQELNQPDLIIPHGDSEALAKKLIELASDTPRVKKLGLAGRQLIIDRYNWRQVVKDTMDEMESILHKKRKRLK